MDNELNLNLDKMLNVVDYTKYAEDYVPSKFAISFVNFIKMVEGNRVENKTPLFHYDILDTIAKHKDSLIVSFRGSAKALPLDAKILTPDGYKLMKNIHVGDQVFSETCKPVTVKAESEIFYKRMYKITLDNGHSFLTSEDHLNVVYYYNKGLKHKGLQKEIKSTRYLYDTRDHTRVWYIPIIDRGVKYTGTYKGIYDENWNDVACRIMKGEEDFDRYLEVYAIYRNKLLVALTRKYARVVDNRYRVIIRDEDLVMKYKRLVDELGGKTWLEYEGDRYLLYYRIQRIRSLQIGRRQYYGKTNPIDWVNGEYNEDRYYKIVKIEKTAEYKECKCIAVGGCKHTYLMEGAVITHNTTLTAEYLILYLAVYGHLPGFGEVNVGMYVGDTMDNGVKNLRNNLEFRYNNSEFLRKFIPVAKFTDPEWEFINADGHKLCFRGWGASTGVRGFKKYGERPVLAIFDDLMSDKSAESKTIVKDIENIIYKAVRQAMHPTRRKTIWIGTPFNKNDPLYKAAGSKAWTTRVFPICNKFPCSPEEFIGAWEDRFPYEAVKTEYEMLKDNGKIDAFNQELMLRILSDEDRLVLDEDIVWYDRSEFKKTLDNCNIYITTDFATSETQDSDFSVISVWALDHKGVFHWIDGIVERQDMSKNVDTLFRFCELYNPLSVGVEVSGQQRGFVSWIRKEMVNRKSFFHLASDKASGEEGLRPNSSKLVRFNVVLPLFKQRKVAFPEDLKESKTIMEFIDELTSATPGGFKSVHDDCIDTISQLAMLEYFVPLDPSVVRKHRELKSENFYNKYYFEDNDDDQYSSINSYIV